VIVVTGAPARGRDDDIRKAAESADVRFYPTVTDALESLPDADAVAGSLSGEQVRNSPRLRWIHSWAAGPNADLTPQLKASDVVLTSSVGNGAVPLAEHSMLLMLMLDRNVPRWTAGQAEHRWERFTHGELNGKTLGIVGLGHSGADLARKAAAFHMRVLGVRRQADLPVPYVEQIYPPERLHQFLGECDFVVVTAPLTDATAGMFDESAFRAMKKSAYWICISRGGIADDAALLRALREGWIMGAGLDVHGVEPLPPESPFWDMPNVIITPHNGATTEATAQRGVDIFLENVSRFVAGEPLINVVDKAHGY
jgi:phosphoglycerate dehydrogenase-like enzyme